MKRRALLATIPVALAGCIGSVPGRIETTTATTTTSTTATNTSPKPDEPNAEFVITDLSVDAAKVAPTYRYFVRITKVYSADAVDREPGDQTIVDVSAIDEPEVRTAIEETLREGKVRRDSIPDGLRELTERVDFFTWEATTSPSNTASHWAIEVFDAHPDRDPVLQFDASLTDHTVSPDDPAAITVSVENVGNRTQEIFSGTVPPFGILWADDPDGDRYLLWRDYEDEGCVTFDDQGRVIVCAIGIITPVEPGEPVEKTYELRPENPVGEFLEPGEYELTDTLSYNEESQGPSTKVEWEVSFTVEET